jgi:hypothetical protein
VPRHRPELGDRVDAVGGGNLGGIVVGIPGVADLGDLLSVGVLVAVRVRALDGEYGGRAATGGEVGLAVRVERAGDLAAPGVPVDLGQVAPLTAADPGGLAGPDVRASGVAERARIDLRALRFGMDRQEVARIDLTPVLVRRERGRDPRQQQRQRRNRQQTDQQPSTEHAFPFPRRPVGRPEYRRPMDLGGLRAHGGAPEGKAIEKPSPIGKGDAGRIKPPWLSPFQTGGPDVSITDPIGEATLGWFL